jgi:hypothetical protein
MQMDTNISEKHAASIFRVKVDISTLLRNTGIILPCTTVSQLEDHNLYV